LHFPL